MAIAFVNKSYASWSSTTAATLSEPSGVQDGDFLIAIVANFQNKSFTKPTGWTDLLNTGTADPALHISYRFRSGTPSYAWVASGSCTGMGVVLAYSGVDTTSPINTSVCTAYTTSNTILRCHSITTAAANCLAIAFAVAYYDGVGDQNATEPSGYSERQDGNYSGVVHIAAADKLYASAGATGDQDWTLADSESYKRGAHVALKPVAASGLLIPVAMCHYQQQ